MNQSKVVVVKTSAKGRWLEILEAIAPALKDAVKNCPNHVGCPVNGGKDGFRLFDDANDTGGGASNQHGMFSNGFDLLMWVLDKDFKGVLNEIADYLGLSGNDWKGADAPKVIPKSKPVDVNKLEKCRYALRRAWQTSYDLTDKESKLARKYLDSRGLTLTKLNLAELSKSVRFNPSMTLYEQRIIEGKKESVFVGNFPALISLVTYPDGSAATIHRTFLDHNGNKLKMNFQGSDINPKKMMSRCNKRRLTGSAIHLYQVQSEVLHIAEGIETGLSIKQMLTDRNITNEAVWACISTTIMEKFEPPKGIKYVVVWSDKDRQQIIRGKTVEAGLDAAMGFANYMEDRDVWPVIMYPQDEIPEGSKSLDWNDILVNKGSFAFPQYEQQLWAGVNCA
ncbi:DUF7146 domain-containing protein [Vibrio coralliilyticus]|uniref:Toprim domain-containing protein n=1 Tax=Vibrio coralliilyticus TaxID=190893 RepID=A0AAP6ZTT2_9VIBR|nr:toprim domain-containing protein [Vibrio coralliilyticus]NOI31997.1 hypothetical protein [Vibrio coralliilyticus]NOJ25198.1 hypothetical protein [Vibrio coralliilyticus]